MPTRRTNRGIQIDMDALINTASPRTPAVGNMRVNAKGDVLGENGEIVQKNEERVRAYYRNNPKSSTSSVSLKGNAAQTLKPETPAPAQEPITSKTIKENTRTQKQKKEPIPAVSLKPDPEPVQEPKEFNAPDEAEPLGYKEVEQENGDIEIVPYYKEEDAE